MRAVHEASNVEGAKATVNALPSALANFDQLPNSAHVRLPVVKGIYGISSATVWRRSKDGTIPQPIKLSERVTGWNVGQIRQSLARIHGGKDAV